MNTILLRGGQAAGLLGFAVIVVAALARLAGNYTLGGLATSTLMGLDTWAGALRARAGLPARSGEK